jgi:hypothetical protein
MYYELGVSKKPRKARKYTEKGGTSTATLIISVNREKEKLPENTLIQIIENFPQRPNLRSSKYRAVTGKKEEKAAGIINRVVS